MTPEEFEQSNLHDKMLDMIQLVNKSLRTKLDIWNMFFHHEPSRANSPPQGRCFSKGGDNRLWFATHCDLALAAFEVLGEK